MSLRLCCLIRLLVDTRLSYRAIASELGVPVCLVERYAALLARAEPHDPRRLLRLPDKALRRVLIKAA